MTSFLQDFRYAVRSLAKDRAFASLAVLALGLGIGSATVIFSAVYGVILNTFPFKDADQVTSFGIQDLRNPGNGRREFLSIPEFLDYRQQNNVFQDISGEYGGFGSAPVRYTAADGTYEFSADYMSANSFAFFGVNPVVGRMAAEEDTKPGATPVFMMSSKLWQKQFNSDPNVVGTSFMLNGTARTLVGIMPPRFRWGWSEIWIPFSIDRGQVASDPELAKGYVWCVGRLKPGASLKSAEADLDVVAHQLAKIYPENYPQQFTVTADRLTDRVVGPFKSLLYPLLGAVLMLLLIACINVANLLLARATAREGEIAIRSSLGAARIRLMQQFLVESFVLAAAGCFAGCLLAYLGIKAVIPFIPYNAFPQEAVIELNPKVLLFSLGLTVVTTFLCGLAPAIHSLRAELRSGLASAGRIANVISRHGKWRAALVIAETAFSVVLLVGTGLMTRTFLAITHIDVGFDPSRIVSARLALPASAYQTKEQQKQFFGRVLERVSAVPGVAAAANSISTPPNWGTRSDIAVLGKTHSETWSTALEMVSQDYFRVLGLQLLGGRLFNSSEIDSARPLLVANQAFVEKFLSGTDPIGQQIKLNALDEVPDAPRGYFEIIGVVSDQKNEGLLRRPIPEVFLPDTIIGIGERSLLVRSAVDPGSLLPAIRRAVWSVDPNVALANAGTLQSFLQRDTFANSQFEAITSGAFAAMGIVLVVIGVFGVMAYTVSLRRHEIGVRMALGAARSHVVTMVLKRGLALIGAGIGFGLIASFSLMRYLASQVWGVSLYDPWTYGIVTACVSVVGLAACLAPARRATRVDPIVALRYD
jgi:putative ABC transport system permease protein